MGIFAHSLICSFKATSLSGALRVMTIFKFLAMNLYD